MRKFSEPGRTSHPQKQDARDSKIFDEWVREETEKIGAEYWRLASERSDQDAISGTNDALAILEKMGLFSVQDEDGRRVYTDEELFSYIDNHDNVNGSIVDLFTREAERRVQLLLAESKHDLGTSTEHEPITIFEVDKMILDPGTGSVERGSGERAFTKKELEPRKEMFQELLRELGLQAIVVPMKSRRELSGEVQEQVDASMRNAMSSDYERVMYTLYVIPEKDLSVFISDLEDEGTQVVSHSPVKKGMSPHEIEGAVSNFLDVAARKDIMKAEGFPYGHKLIKFYEEDAWRIYMKTFLNHPIFENLASEPTKSNDVKDLPEHDSEEDKRAYWKEQIVQQYPYERFIRMDSTQRASLRVNGAGLAKIGSLFGIRGNLRNIAQQLELALLIYDQHRDEIEKLLEIETRPLEVWRQRVAEEFPYDRYMRMSVNELPYLSVDGKGISAIGRLFELNTATTLLSKLEFASAIYVDHRDEIEKLLEIETRPLEVWRQRIQEAYPYTVYIKMTQTDRQKKLEVDGKKISALGGVFGMKSDVRNVLEQLKFARLIYPDHVKDIDNLISQEERSVDKWKEIIREKVPYETYIGMNIAQRSTLINIDGKKIKALAGILGLKGYRRTVLDQLELAKLLYPDHSDEIDNLISREKRSVDEWKQIIRDRMPYEIYMGMNVNERSERIEIDGKKLAALGSIFGIKGDLRGSEEQMSFAQTVYGEQR